MSCITLTTRMNRFALHECVNRTAFACAAAVCGFALVLSSPATGYAGAAPGKDGRTPITVVEQTASRALDIVRDKTTSADQKKDMLQKLFTQATDVYTVSRLVLARNWKRLSESEQTEFQEVFCRHLSTTYGRNLDNYPNLDDFAQVAVEITGQRTEARGDYTVMSKITRPNGEPILVDYRLRNLHGSWKIIDVVIEGVSMISNFRSQFQDVVSKHGAKNLITRLREKDTKGEKAKLPSKEPTSAARPDPPAVDLAKRAAAP